MLHRPVESAQESVHFESAGLLHWLVTVVEYFVQGHPMYSDRLFAWVDEYLPELTDSFNPPASVEDINDLENLVGITFPEQLRDLYLFANGQNSEASTGLWYGFHMLSLERIKNDWQSWYEIYTDEYLQDTIVTDEHSSYREGCVRPMYTNPKWLPLANDSGGNCFGLDYDPGPNGTLGQVINFGRDEYVKYVLGESFADFLKWYVEQLESGNYTITHGVYGGVGANILNTKYPPTTHFLDAVPTLFK